MKEEYKPLLTPWKIRDVEIKNRIVLAPMGGTCLFGWMEPCHFDKEAAKLILGVAENNCGLVIPGIAPIRDVLGRRWLYTNKRMFKELADFMVEIHKTGAKLFVQLTAGFGRAMALTGPMALLASHKVLNTIAKPVMDAEFLTAAPSVSPNRWADNVTARPITKKEIAQMVYAFGETARLCKEAGVDGVEIHAVHEGYLLDQFTLPYCNQRTDEYGGSFENRYRFPVEIVKEIKGKCGEDYPVSLRYSVVSKTKGFRSGAMPGEDYIEVGRTMEESEKAAKYLQDAGYDMLNCDNGTYDAWYWAHPPQYMPLNCNLEDVAHIKKFVDIPVVCAGRMTPAAGAKAVAAGEIDGMAVGRQFLCDPAWFTKLINDEEEEIRPCICCHAACFDLTKYNGSANAQSFSGVGGMETARVAALRGHKVTIYEKSDKLGGIFIAAAAPEFKENDKELIKWYIHQCEKNPNITIKLNTEVKDPADLGADEIVVATGSAANRIPIKGVDNAVEACDYLLDKKPVGDTVVIVGGGLSGCEIALDLFRKGKRDEERPHGRQGSLPRQLLLSPRLLQDQQCPGISRDWCQRDWQGLCHHREEGQEPGEDCLRQCHHVGRLSSDSGRQEEQTCPSCRRLPACRQPPHRCMGRLGRCHETVSFEKTSIFPSLSIGEGRTAVCGPFSVSKNCTLFYGMCEKNPI